MKLEDLFEMKNVVGHKEDEDRVTVFVTKKLTMPEIQEEIRKGRFRLEDIVPPTMKLKRGLFGLARKEKKTDVVEVGEVKAHADRHKYRPVRPGCEIGPKGVNSVGTLGAFVRVKFFRGSYLIGPMASFIALLERFGYTPERRWAALTNSHVANIMATMPAQALITQPGAMDHESLVIGKTLYSHPIRTDGVNEIDAALIEMIPGQGDTNTLGGVGEIKGVDDVQVDEEVEKYGRTTYYTKGRCTSKGVTLRVSYKHEGAILFTGLDMFTKMSDGGDSGSVALRISDHKAVSLIFAGSPSHTFGTPLSKVKETLNFEV